ncbi:MAG: hypothetical protein AB1611_12700 [bacterium]
MNLSIKFSALLPHGSISREAQSALDGQVKGTSATVSSNGLQENRI